MAFYSTGIFKYIIFYSNEGSYRLPLLLEITDEENWFGAQTIEVTLEPNSTQSVSFNGNIASATNTSLIQLSLKPIHHPNKAKTISVIGYNESVSNDNFIK